MLISSDYGDCILNGSDTGVRFYMCKMIIRLALVGYIKLFIVCILFIILDISLQSFISIVNVWLV